MTKPDFKALGWFIRQVFSEVHALPTFKERASGYVAVGKMLLLTPLVALHVWLLKHEE
jgi:hypothetical protein